MPIGSPVLRGFSPVAASGTAPGEPTISISNDGDGDAVTVTVDGDASATNTLYYRKADAEAWTEGDNRSGDGDIAQSGLDAEVWYQFVVVSSSGSFNSIPSKAIGLLVTAGTSHIYQIEHILDLKERGADMEIIAVDVTDME